MSTQELVINVGSDGNLEFLMEPEAGDLLQQGMVVTRRASHILPKGKILRIAFKAIRGIFGETGKVSEWTRQWQCRWIVDLGPSGGPVLGWFGDRRNAIAAEQHWLANNGF